jgi:hypothetical protein
MSDGTNPADPGHNIGHLFIVPSTQKRLKHPRRLKDVELDFDHLVSADLYYESAFPFHAG